MMARLVLLVCALAAAGSAGAACPPQAGDGSVLRQGAVVLAWRTEPGTLRVGQPFGMTLQLCPAEASLVRADASMPEHRHGMNYKPSLHALGGGRWRVDGLLWHMAGRWELRWDVRTGVQADAAVEVLRASVTLQ